MESAQYQALALEIGAISTESVQQWVLNIASSAKELDGPLLELTYLDEENTHEFISLLKAFPADEEKFVVLRRILSNLPNNYKNDKQRCRDIARCLYGVYVDSGYEVPDDFTTIGFFDDEYDLADRGILFKDTDT